LDQAIEANAYQGVTVNDASKKPTNPRKSGQEKIEEVYKALDDIETLLDSVLDNVGSYLSCLADINQNRIASDCVALGRNAIHDKVKLIRRTLDNSKDKKDAVQAHSILARQDKKERKRKMQSLLVSMRNDPGGELQATLDFVKEMMPRATTSDIENADSENATSTPLTSDKENSPIDPPAQPNTNNDATSSSPTKKKARPSNDSNEFVINVSLPEDGKMYRVEEAINIFMHAQANVADLSQSSNLNTHRSYLSAYKKAMLKYLPIKMTAFNCQIKNASKPGALLSLAGKGWDDKGRPPLLSIDEILQTQTAQQASHANKGWKKSDTEAALIDAAKRKKTE
jgi:hypothetical protein